MRMERKEETRAVKQLLAGYGIGARVGHGRGTAWGWLEINIGKGQQFGEHVAEDHSLHRCPRCGANRIVREFLEDKVRELTGRRGEYGGNICTSAQDHWTDKKGSVPIEHDMEKMLVSVPGLAGLVSPPATEPVVVAKPVATSHDILKAACELALSWVDPNSPGNVDVTEIMGKAIKKVESDMGVKEAIAG